MSNRRPNATPKIPKICFSDKFSDSFSDKLSDSLSEAQICSGVIKHALSSGATHFLGFRMRWVERKKINKG